MRRFAAGLCILFLAGPTFAAEAPLKILTPGYGQLAMQELEPLIEKTIGGPVDIEIVGTGGIPERILKGDKIDFVLTYRESLAPAKDRIQAQTDVAVSHVAIAVADNAALPVFKTHADVAAFLKATPSLARSTSLSGQHMALVIEKLGLTEEMKPKVTTSGGLPGTQLKEGKVAAAAQQVSELRLAGLKNIVPLPDGLQTDLVLTAATIHGTTRAADTKKIVGLLQSADAAKAYVNAGLKPAK
ncbi:MAG: substrate-binding domain-containing protein [Rhodospirillaceae bacterium]